MRNRTRLGLVAVVATSAIALAGCTAGGAAPSSGDSEEVELTMLVQETPNLTPDYWERMFERANEAVDGVNVTPVYGENSLEYVQSLFASGQAPDIFGGGIPVEPFAAKGQIAEWSEEDLGPFTVPDNFGGYVDGKLYAISGPNSSQGIAVMFYNKDLFEQAGIEEPPATWEEFLEACEALKAAGIAPIGIGGGGEDTWVAEMAPVSIIAADVLSEDPEWFEKRKAGEVSFTDPEFVAAVEKTVELSESGYFDMAGLSRTYADTEQAFRDQKAAMYPMGIWFAASADKNPPDFEVGVFAIPSDDANVFPLVTGSSGTMINAEAEDVELAKEWVVAFGSVPGNVEEFMLADGGLIPEGVEVPEAMGETFIATNDVYRQAVADDNVVTAWLYDSRTVPPGFSGAIDPAIVDLINLRISPQDFGAFLDQKWDELSAQ